MKKSIDIVNKILSASSKSDDFSSQISTPPLERYKNFLISFLDNYENKDPLKFQRYLLIIEIVLTAIGSGIGFFLIFAGANDYIKLTVWICFIILIIIVRITIKLIPKDIDTYYIEAAKLRLINLCERLAAEVALFDLIYDSDYEDNYEVIQAISSYLPDLNTLDEQSKQILKNCINETKVFENSRETNIRIPKLNLDEEIIKLLHESTHKIVDLCRYLFAGHDFTAKIYLRTLTQFEEKDVEILTSFSKYPVDMMSSKNIFGTSWVKARGNPSIIWKCLESGKTQHVKKENMGRYYDSTLTMCLPGRIGVLALASRNINAFESKYDEWVEKSLIIATQVLVHKSLAIPRKRYENK